jgi:predicted small integral membrane protein
MQPVLPRYRLTTTSRVPRYANHGEPTSNGKSTPMPIARTAKIVISFALALFCLLVAFDNLTDYTTNYLFVQHVMSMDTTYPGSELRYRAITNPTLWQLAYGAIILGEAVTGALFLVGAYRLFQARDASAAEFNRAKSATIAASLLVFLVWYFGFMVVAGEWFAMWESQTWNGQEPAFRFYMTVLAVLIFVVMPDGDLGDAAPTRQTPKRRRTDK